MGADGDAEEFQVDFDLFSLCVLNFNRSNKKETVKSGGVQI